MNYDKYYARSGYESLILQQPQIYFEGLWEVNDRYFIVCPSLTTSPITSSGKQLADWFDNECRVIGSPVSLIQKTPPGATRVPERTAEELSLLHGEPLTISEVSREISNALSRQFPLLRMTSPKMILIIEVSREISNEEVIELEIALSNYKIDLNYEIVVRNSCLEEEDKQDKKFNPYIGVDNLALLPSRMLPDAMPSEVRDAYAEDEEFWVDHRVPLLASNDLGREAVLPHAFRAETSSCFIDATVFEPTNIRTYLPIYHRIIVAMPLQKELLKALNGFGVSKQELLELVSRGRVQFILPQPIQRYDIRFLAEVLNANSSSILLSRKLSMASVVETRSRLPFLYPAFGTQDRRAVLEAFASVDDPKLREISQSIGQNLGLTWLGMERNLSVRGAMGNISHGIGPLLGKLVTQVTGRDCELELATSSMPVEWAAALRSTYFPVERGGYSSYSSASLCASMYSGVRNSPTVNPIEDFQSFVSGLLTLDNDAPVLEVDSAFSHRDIDQLAALLSGMNDRGERQVLIDKANENIGQFEKNSERLNRLDFYSLGGAAAGVLSGNLYLPLGVWIAQYILSKADPSIDFGGRAMDWVRGANSYTSADVVMLSRVRKKVSSAKRS